MVIPKKNKPYLKRVIRRVAYADVTFGELSLINRDKIFSIQTIIPTSRSIPAPIRASINFFVILFNWQRNCKSFVDFGQVFLD